MHDDGTNHNISIGMLANQVQASTNQVPFPALFDLPFSRFPLASLTKLIELFKATVASLCLESAGKNTLSYIQ